VARIGEMLSYQSYNVKSPLNGEAARWAEKNAEELPLDKVSMLVDMNPQAAKAAVPKTDPPARPASPAPQRSAPPSRPAAEAPAETRPPRPQPAAAASAPARPPADTEQGLALRCPKCSEKYRVPAAMAGKRVRCRECQTIIAIPAFPTDE
ncbi:MAG: hypothetical protein NT069_33685, partial [Planctomycetota bacterium]|nr:hypothetical protein [Planctomycetota bacterium]